MKAYLLSSVLWSVASFATPFDTCPSKAFLIQGNTATVYGVNLVSGSYNTLANDMGTNNKVNAVGFSVHDRYLYGWDYESGNLAKIGKDYQLESLSVSGFAKTSFYVGDVSVQTNHYYAYRRGASFGLYKVSLDPNNEDYLNANRVVDGAKLNLQIFDLAFHPDEDFAYSVDKNGVLHRIDVLNGTSSALGNTGITGTFGAVYFDVDGNFYISRNSDGNVFLIDLDNPSNNQLFAYGPDSSSNDGARCAIAPIIDDSEPAYIDFGDAPNSYLTKLADNGPRHETGDLFLGTQVTPEYQPKDNDEDDGIDFVTGFEIGLDTLILANSSRSGYLNAWIDWDQSGTFDNNERVVQDYATSTGQNRLLLAVPENAADGTTWARFRLSDQPGISFTGGVANGEVEDYAITVSNSGIATVSTDWMTIAFEDFWPEQGDYDFNDVVVTYKVQMSKIGEQLKRYKIDGSLKAIGASHRNGFAFRFQNIAASSVNQALIRYEINGQLQTNSPLENGRNEAILILFADTKAVAPVLSGCKYFRTERHCQSQESISFSITLPFNEAQSPNNVGFSNLDPFIFGVNGFDHGPLVSVANARGWEVHLKNQAPTEAFDPSYLNQADDASSSNGFYQTSSGLPFAIKVGTQWRHPIEHTDILQAYPQLASFAESRGAENTAWFLTPSDESLVSY
ncbi:hypothetical protein PSECIP111951_01793 [Pseudoalteromonas holothuriae]|uniref:LruC domain-containing protein n=1 Tax=Pseudoalteromonas holothuriae TaxID=2963714 RepID=A0ABN8UPB9_9GAMM|nr:LruC domain-containing protein [Pseudoalteromonas sp. CIP111951]CAH9058059.1 hypothetical protein PSECIP111951_01793 [Pseudoalteromonas sp. CIP111951]